MMRGEKPGMDSFLPWKRSKQNGNNDNSNNNKKCKQAVLTACHSKVVCAAGVALLTSPKTV